jgi:predicted  nucleic acid-binding Zn-ribbon protein
MEAIEQNHDKLEARENQTALRQDQLNNKKETLSAQLPSLESSLVEAVALRSTQANAVREDHLIHYEKIRQKLRHAVVTISDEACNSCGMGISSMPLAEHKRGSAVHYCANCGRFLGELI